MKIFILNIDKTFMPEKVAFRYPKHSKDYGVEQDFYDFLIRQEGVELTDNADEADWHYLPVYWTRWHLNHNFAQTGIDELSRECRRVLIDEKKTFTICQYDDGPVIDIGSCAVFLSSRMTDEGRDIPLLCSPHKLPFFRPKLKYIASFTGRIKTHKIRSEMTKELEGVDGYLIRDGDFKSKAFVKGIVKAHVSLCPRGYGGSSFRLYESMALGVVPYLIGDIDTRPFQKFIDWDKISFYSKDVGDIKEKLATTRKDELLEMGSRAKSVFEEQLTFGKWCKLVLDELGRVKYGRQG